MKLKKLFLVSIFLFELNTTRLWFACRDFSDAFHFSFLKTNLNLKGAVNNDIGLSPVEVRFFHNKLVFVLNQIYVNYFHFWDIRFGITFFSIIGYIGVFMGFWYLLKSSHKYKWIIFTILLLVPFVEVFGIRIAYPLRLVFLSIPFQALSLFGLWGFVKAYRSSAILILLVLFTISIWYLVVFQRDIFLNCLKI